VRLKLSKGRTKIRQVASQVKRFEEPHAAANLEALRPGKFARTVMIEQECLRLELFAQKNCAEFSSAQSIFLTGR
jgi:hypothetical protein